MKSFCKNIFPVILLSLMAILPSCSDREVSGIIPSEDGESHLILKISPATRASENSDLEYINSIRVILLDQSGKVKANKRQDFNQYSVSNFSTEFDLYTQEGPAYLYVIANEESLTKFRFDGDDADYTSASLSDLLGNFTAGRSGFEDFINSIVYTLDLSKPLPMTCMYEFNVTAGRQEKEVYLVNTTTKFEIQFRNYRSSSVTFNSVGIEKVADKGYLMASIDPEYRNVDNMYWIDWMKKVVEETNEHRYLDDTDESNNLVNDRLGWLTNYNTPRANYSLVNFMDQDVEREKWEIKAATPRQGEMPTPTEMSKGFFYYPESKYIPSNSTTQLYTLVIEVNSQTEGPLTEGTQTLRRELQYIKTLFRNTHAILHVDLYTGSEDIYAEIKRWGETGTTYGKIQPE